MKRFFHRPYSWAVIFSLLLTGSSIFVLLDTFVIPKSYARVEEPVQQRDEAEAEEETDETAYTDTSYEDENIIINIETVREYDTTVYIADIQLTDVSYLKTALAEDTFGRNVKEPASVMADRKKAILAVNGDFYGFRDYGFVLRNGTLYRDTPGDSQDLVIDAAGDFFFLDERHSDINALDLTTLWQVLSFGPPLVEAGEIVVNSDSEVAQSMRSNPRTAIGMIAPLHYIMVVSDGRTEESAGLSLLNLARIFTDRNCACAYNLDGGGSTTMYFRDRVVNIPTDGRIYGEREVSDIVYIGY